jgi:quercetin dioxygenase-like cupin family protein
MHMMKVALALLLIAGPSAWAQVPAPQRLVPNDAKPGIPTATIDLGNEFPQMKGFILRQTLATVEPGTGRAWHSHAQSPEIARILSGTLTEARNGGLPTAYGPGSTLVNDGKTEHMWANMGSEPVVMLLTSVHEAKK